MAAEIQNDGNILSVPPLPLRYEIGIGQVVFKNMIKNKDSIAQIDGLTGQKDSLGSILQRSIRTAIAMRSKGITPNDIITVCSFNHLNTNIPIFASLFLGVKTASTEPSLSLEDTTYLLNQVRPKMVFASPNAVKLMEDTLQKIGLDSEIVVFGETGKHTSFSEFLVESPEEKTFAPVEVKDLKETVSIFFSSGTSGMPKGICVTHLAVLAVIPREDAPESFEGMISLAYSPPYWVSSFLFAVIGVVTRHCRIILPSFDVNNIWTMIEKYKILLVFLSPTQIAAILTHGRPDDVDLSSVKLFVTGGSPISKEQLDKVRKVFSGAFAFSGYGQTELCGGGLSFRIAANPEEILLALERPTSCGKPNPGYSVKIVDPETEEILGANKQGELRIKTEYQMNGYHNLDSSNAWDKDGFLKTGDIAYYDEDYCFYIVDRIKEMLKFQNFQIAPAKLEAILVTHPAIESAVVIGLPHPADGDHPLALVVLNKSGIKVTPEEIEKYVEERVDDRQRLRGGVKIVEALQVTPTGKFKRKQMKDLVLQGKL